jgi:hypothetical protein
VRKLSVFALGIAAAALAGAAIAAGPRTHVMNVPLADGSSVRVEYVGDVAPKVSVAPAQDRGFWAPVAFPGFGNFDRVFEQMNRQMQQIQQMARQPGAAVAGSPYVASYGSMPPGATSYSVSTVSDGACTRTTEVVSQGDNKPPKVTTSSSGKCAPAAASAAPAAPTGPINRT